MTRLARLAAIFAALILPASATAAESPTHAEDAAEWAIYMDAYRYSQATGNAIVYYSGVHCNNSSSQTPTQFPCWYTINVGGYTFNKNVWLQAPAPSTLSQPCYSGDDPDGPWSTGAYPWAVTSPGVRGYRINGLTDAANELDTTQLNRHYCNTYKGTPTDTIRAVKISPRT